MPRQTRKIVLVGRTHDAHVPFVAPYLDHELVVIDIGRMIEGGMSYHFTPGHVWPAVTLDGRQVELHPSDVASVWYRNDDIVDMAPIPISRGYESYRESSVMSLRRMGYSLRPMLCPNAFWVSDPLAIQQAELKPFQLVDATRCGFNVPRTLYTTSPKDALEFIKAEGTCVIKPLAPRSPVGKGQPTRLLRYQPGLDLRGIKIQAHILQQALSPLHHLRVATIGSEVFASKLSDGTEDEARSNGIIDVRHGFETDAMHAEPFVLPPAIAEACRQYVLWLKGLVCGFFDLIVDENGTFYFLECNANGQWAFVDAETAAKIGQTLATLLQRGTL